MAGRLHTIGEVAQLTGVPIKTIRYCADLGLLPPARTTEARYRLYSPTEIWRLEPVRTLRHVGFSLDEIRRILTGDIDVATAIAWQLEALEGQISHLTRLRDLLRQASAAQPDDERSLAFLHGIGTAVTRNAEEGSWFLTAKLGAALGGDAVPRAWTEPLLLTARPRLPAEPTAEQAAAWAELVALLDDAEFVAAMVGHAAPFWELVRQREVDGNWWHGALAEINEWALAAVRDDAGPDSPAVQGQARDWASLFAQALGQPGDEAFLRRFAAIAANFVDDRLGASWSSWSAPGGAAMGPRSSGCSNSCSTVCRRLGKALVNKLG